MASRICGSFMVLRVALLQQVDHVLASVPPPAPKGTITSMLWLGKSVAQAGPAPDRMLAATASGVQAIRRRLIILFFLG